MSTPEAKWSRQLFDSLSNGGAWGVPRSGLVFTKRGDAMVLASRMPHDERMPYDKSEWESLQQSAYELIKEKFAEAGIMVTDKSQSPTL